MTPMADDHTHNHYNFAAMPRSVVLRIFPVDVLCYIGIVVMH